MTLTTPTTPPPMMSLPCPPKRKLLPLLLPPKSGVEEITSGPNKSKAKGSCLHLLLDKVQDPVLIRPVWVNDQQYVEFGMSLAAALMCTDGIQAVLAPDGMSVSLQRGVYSSFFTNRRYRKDQGKKYSKDSSSVTSHRKVSRTVAASQLIAKCVTNSRRRRVCEMESCMVSTKLSCSHASVQDWSKRSSLGEFKQPSHIHHRYEREWYERRGGTRAHSIHGEHDLQGEDGGTGP